MLPFSVREVAVSIIFLLSQFSIAGLIAGSAPIKIISGYLALKKLIAALVAVLQAKTIILQPELIKVIIFCSVKFLTVSKSLIAPAINYQMI